MKKYKIILLTAGLVAASAMSACQKNPEESIVKNKDFDKMVEQAKDGENGVSSPKDVAKENETYKNSFSDESLGVEVEIDATLDIPDTDKLAIYRVKKKQISQAQLDKLFDCFLGDDQLYDASWMSRLTKKEIEEEIQDWKQNVENVKERIREGVLPESELQLYQDECDEAVNELKEAYETAPDEISFEGYETEGKIRDVSDTEYGENKNVCLFKGTNGGENGKYKAFSAENNEDYGNFLCYRESMDGPIVAGGVIPEMMIIGRELLDGATEFKEYELTISEDEAISKAGGFIEDMGLEDYRVYKCEKRESFEELRNNNNDNNVIDFVYVVTYMRNINGAFLLPADSKTEQGWQGDTYVKRFWPVEYIDILVSDKGIIGVDYCTPLEFVDTVVEESAVKKFDEVKGIFENMVIPMYAEEDSMKRVKVDSIKLGYAIISEKDNYETGLLVPVWDFCGTVKRYDDISERTIMTINAIDGTIIDRAVGY